jgi:pilus assembly protein TadC
MKKTKSTPEAKNTAKKDIRHSPEKKQNFIHHEVKTEIIQGTVPEKNADLDKPAPQVKPAEKKSWFAKTREPSKKPHEIKINTKRFKKKSGLEIFSFRGFLKNIQLTNYLELAGIEADPKKIIRKIMNFNLAIALLALLFWCMQAIMNESITQESLLFIAGSTIGLFAVTIIISWILVLFYLDMAIYRRTKEVERVFPDFLQLASSNISAGMPIDRALWYAVRPNFGVLSKEIETVAKNTLAGQDLAEALTDFSKKYNSKVIQRSISLVLEGLAAGGELADLLNKIAIDIEETRLLKQDMAANVTTYVIFITFAAIVAAPALLGLSTQLLEVIARITASMAEQTAGSSSNSFFSFSAGGNSISTDNFKIFSYTMLSISGFFAAMIVNVIQTGRVKDGISKIPIFIVVSLLIYFASSSLMGMMFAGLV